ncbi:expressed unknown protein [Seminavis robusta]|uniref:Uncharacterized protein n=1 Tax=Seminavis robusta TaxID=568900 RepID=A0A9N8DVG3_9STRA|nr:expressed unknown protein [Seminavis robusta]|eukprot:Sro312_g114580.1 n/a (139) ;mRNA; r:31941-32357
MSRYGPLQPESPELKFSEQADDDAPVLFVAAGLTAVILQYVADRLQLIRELAKTGKVRVLWANKRGLSVRRGWLRLETRRHWSQSIICLKKLFASPRGRSLPDSWWIHLHDGRCGSWCAHFVQPLHYSFAQVNNCILP